MGSHPRCITFAEFLGRFDCGCVFGVARVIVGRMGASGSTSGVKESERKKMRAELKCLKGTVSKSDVERLARLYAVRDCLGTNVALTFVEDVEKLAVVEQAVVESTRLWVQALEGEIPFYQLFSRLVAGVRVITLTQSATGLVGAKESLVGSRMTLAELNCALDSKREAPSSTAIAPQPAAPILSSGRDVLMYLCSFLSLNDVCRLSQSCRRLFEVCNVLLGRLKPPAVFCLRMREPFAKSDVGVCWRNPADEERLWSATLMRQVLMLTETTPSTASHTSTVLPMAGVYSKSIRAVPLRHFVLIGLGKEQQWAFVDLRTGASGCLTELPFSFEDSIFCYGLDMIYSLSVPSRAEGPRKMVVTEVRLVEKETSFKLGRDTSLEVLRYDVDCELRIEWHALGHRLVGFEIPPHTGYGFLDSCFVYDPLMRKVTRCPCSGYVPTDAAGAHYAAVGDDMLMQYRHLESQAAVFMLSDVNFFRLRDNAGYWSRVHIQNNLFAKGASAEFASPSTLVFGDTVLLLDAKSLPKFVRPSDVCEVIAGVAVPARDCVVNARKK